MTTIARMRFGFSGPPVVGPGVATFYSSNLAPGAFATAVGSFFAACSGLFPTGLQITEPAGGELIEDSDGSLQGVWSRTPAAPITGGGGAGAFAAGVGLRVVWLTNGVRNNRRVRGSTFMVPCMASTYQSDGSIADSNIALVRTAALVLTAADSGSMRIWSRPSSAGASDGSSSAVYSAQVPDKVTWLRSRRT